MTKTRKEKTPPSAPSREDHGSAQVKRMMDSLKPCVFAGVAAPDGTLIYANRQSLDAIGQELKDVAGQPVLDTPWLAHSPVATRKKAARALAAAAQGLAAGFECAYRRTDGAERVLDVWVKPSFDPDGKVDFLVLSSHDTTERREIEGLLHVTHEAIDRASIGVMRITADGQVQSANRSMCALLGYTVEDIRGIPVNRLSKRVAEEGWDLLWKKLRRRGPEQYEAVYLRADGREIPVEVVATSVKDSGEEYCIAFVTDLTEQREAEKRIHFLAHYDPLTGLPNRSSFIRIIERYLVEKPEASKVAVLIIDLQRFWSVNESFGREEGDRLLIEVAERLLQYSNGQVRFSRLGADQFAAVIPNVNGREDVQGRVRQKMKACFGRPFHLCGQELRISARYGVAVSTSRSVAGEALLRKAETALVQAKRSGDTHAFFASSMSQVAAERLHLENRLRAALERREFVLHYQPKVSSDGHKIEGVEALLRWNDKGELIPPQVFMTLLEQTGMIVEVGEWVLEQAIADFLRWQRAGLDAPRIAINVSAVQLRKPDFVAMLARGLERTGGKKVGIDLEITESVVMEDLDGCIRKLLTARAMGFQVAIDDFGTGYSSLAYLTRLPVQHIKIDRTFISGMLEEAAKLTMVRAIISLAHSLNFKVIAEGVETGQQAAALREHGCDQMQGFLFGRPVSADELAVRLPRAKQQGE